MKYLRGDGSSIKIKIIYTTFFFFIFVLAYNHSLFAVGGTCVNNQTGGTQAGITCGLQDNCEPGYIAVISGKTQTSCGTCTCTPQAASDPADGCGSTSQPCCNTAPKPPCDTPQLRCYNVPRVGPSCLSQSQIDALPGDSVPQGSPITITAKTCPDGKSIETALGCVPYEPLPLIEWILKWGIGIGGGIAFLLMAFASFQLMTSSGDPERVKGGQEMFVSAGAGLLFIIFSVFLLQLIGADILQIPGFGN